MIALAIGQMAMFFLSGTEVEELFRVVTPLIASQLAIEDTCKHSMWPGGVKVIVVKLPLLLI